MLNLLKLIKVQFDLCRICPLNERVRLYKTLSL
nr:MAG TPA: GLOBAL NITROGEN REGULATOR, PIPX, NITROGEN ASSIMILATION, CRP/FNR SUPERFAMILY [Caudoviricetes sp.]